MRFFPDDLVFIIFQFNVFQPFSLHCNHETQLIQSLCLNLIFYFPDVNPSITMGHTMYQCVISPRRIWQCIPECHHAAMTNQAKLVLIVSKMTDLLLLIEVQTSIIDDTWFSLLLCVRPWLVTQLAWIQFHEQPLNQIKAQLKYSNYFSLFKS